MSGPGNRRGFLRGLTMLPLIGGGVTLIGAPSAVALPVTPALLKAYTDWLAVEYGEALIELDAIGAADKPVRIALAVERFRREWCQDNGTLNPSSGGGRRFERPPVAAPSTRAAIVLAAVGADWQESGR
ncbi:hypothetical protein [Methylobacterium sp. J-077]|uniref:hypothetical protein n=1 Tax=Methylobacterium sp. J-077 TaxID=2836656 RepID=UPI001FBBEE5E|nr:hypothetical protein [Methylobacterium sp. J-077]MCJ2126656.1 hypothetical protein [Methylobacterium sp. J-077]